MSITASNVDESKLTQINNCINEANKILPPNSTPIPTIDKGVIKTVNDTSNNKNKYIIIGIIICVLIFMSILSIGIVIV